MVSYLCLASRLLAAYQRGQSVDLVDYPVYQVGFLLAYFQLRPNTKLSFDNDLYDLAIRLDELDQQGLLPDNYFHRYGPLTLLFKLCPDLVTVFSQPRTMALACQVSLEAATTYLDRTAFDLRFLALNLRDYAAEAQEERLSSCRARLLALSKRDQQVKDWLQRADLFN